MEKLEAKLTPSTPEHMDRLLSQVNTALTAREKVLIKEASVLSNKGRESEISQEHRTDSHPSLRTLTRMRLPSAERNAVNRNRFRLSSRDGFIALK